MGEDFRQTRQLSEQEKKKIARDMIEGYKKMATLNQKLAENEFTVDETEKRDEADS